MRRNTAETDPREKNFGERSQIDNQSPMIHRLDRQRDPAKIFHFLFKCVLNQRQAMFFAQGEQIFPTDVIHGDSGGILEIRRDKEQGRFAAPQQIPQPVEIQLGASSEEMSQVLEGDLNIGDLIVLNPPTVFDQSGPPPFVRGQ